MVKSAQPGVAGGCTPSPFTLSTITSKVVVYSPADKGDTVPLFLLYPYMYSVACTMRSKARGLVQHGGPPGLARESAPQGMILYVMDGPCHLP